MAKQIQRKDIIELNPFKNLEKSAKDAKRQVTLLEQSLKILKESAKTTQKALPKTKPRDVKSIKEFNQLTIQANQIAKQKLKIDKQLLHQKEALRLANQKQNKEIKARIELSKAETGSLNKVRAENKLLVIEKGKVNRLTKEGARRIKDINRQLDRNNKILQRNSSQLGKQKINIGNYGSAVGRLTGMLAKLGLGFGVFALLRNSFNTIKEFDQAQANLSSILDVTRNQMQGLTEQAKELGATTRFTAVQVSELQLSLAKLGFTQTQIQQMTASVLDLAAATGTELGETATVVGATLRGFGLEARETQRVTDVMAKSFSKSSLDMTKFSTAMATVAPVANAMGLSIEETTALIATMTDTGVDASTAGTGLRNMFLNAKKEGLTLDEALEKIKNSTDKVGTSFDIFGKRGATLGVILAENTDRTAELVEELDKADGAAEDMAETQIKTLSGSIDLVKSAWDGYILKLDEAGGVGEKIRHSLGFIAENLETILMVLGKVIKAYALYRAALLAIKLNEHWKDLRRYNSEMKKSNKATKDLSKGAGKLRGALKAIGWAAAIAGVVSWFNAIKSAVTEAGRLQKTLDEISKQTAKANKTVEDRSLKRSEDLADKLEEIELSTAFKTEKARAKAKFAALKANEALIRSDIETAKIRQKQAEQNLKVAKARAASVDGFMTKSAEAAEALAGGLFLSGDQKYLIDIQNQLSKAKAAVKGTKVEVKGFREELKGSNKALTTNTRELAFNENQLNNNTNEIKENIEEQEKAVSLMREIEDEQIKQIKNQQEQENIQASTAANRRIIDLKTQLTDEDELARLIIEINKNLTAELTAIDKKYRDEAEARRKAFYDKQAADAIKFQSNLLKHLRLSLLESGATDEEIEKELLEARIQILKMKTKLTLDEEIELQKLLRKQKSKADKEEADAEKAHQAELSKLKKDALDAAEDLFIKQIDKRIAKMEEESDAAQKQADLYRELAANGNITAKESLAKENQIIQEAEAEKERLEKRKQQILLVSSILKSYNSNLEKGDDSTTAFTKAITSKAALDQFIAGIGSFFDGTEDTGTVANGLDSNGGRFAVLHNNERVLTAKENKKIGNYSNEQVANIMENHRLGKLVDGNQISPGWDNQKIVNELLAVGGKLDQVNKSIQNKEVSRIELGEITQSAMKIVETRTKGPNRTTNTFKVKK